MIQRPLKLNYGDMVESVVKSSRVQLGGSRGGLRKLWGVPGHRSLWGGARRAGGDGKGGKGVRAVLPCLREHVVSMPVAALLMGCQGRLSVSYPPGGAWRRVDLATPWGLDCVCPLRLGRRSWKRNSEISSLSQSACGMSLRCRNPHAAFETNEPRAAGGREPGQSGQSGRSRAPSPFCAIRKAAFWFQ